MSAVDERLGLLSASMVGMALGLAIDCASIPPEALASLCATRGSWFEVLALHWRVMPTANALMLLGATVAAVAVEWPRRRQLACAAGAKACGYAACFIAMALGMAFGSRFGAQLAALLSMHILAGLGTAMALGMVGGMLVLAPLRLSPARLGGPVGR